MQSIKNKQKMSKQFGEHTPALEVVEGIDLKGYDVIVTGGNSGIGVLI